MIEFVQDWYQEILMGLAALVAFLVVAAAVALLVHWIFWGGGAECVDPTRHRIGNALTGACVK